MTIEFLHDKMQLCICICSKAEYTCRLQNLYYFYVLVFPFSLYIYHPKYDTIIYSLDKTNISILFSAGPVTVEKVQLATGIKPEHLTI